LLKNVLRFGVDIFSFSMFNVNCKFRATWRQKAQQQQQQTTTTTTAKQQQQQQAVDERTPSVILLTCQTPTHPSTSTIFRNKVNRENTQLLCAL